MWNNYNPNKAISIGAFFSVGEEFWYDEDNPAVGNHLYTGTLTTIQPNSKLRIRTTIRYGQLKSKVDQSIYFSGSLTRTTVNYQFNNNLSFRLVGEHNSFDDKFFIQPLLKWNSNPFTVFYAGGSHGYRRPEVNPSVEKNFELENSQLYLKFQYLFDI